jgi:hypothetical protein
MEDPSIAAAMEGDIDPEEVPKARILESVFYVLANKLLIASSL